MKGDFLLGSIGTTEREMGGWSEPSLGSRASLQKEDNNQLGEIKALSNLT